MIPVPVHSTSTLPVPPGVPTLLRDLLHEHIGIYFEPDRFDTMIDKLRARLAVRELGSLLDYFYLLKYDGDAVDEWLHVMDVFSVPETYFWRETAQVHALVNVVVPEWFKRHPCKPLRIWSAACATGEEPYSLAIALQEAGWGGHPIAIVASDASGQAIERARTAVYRERSFRSLPAELRARYFDPPDTEGSRLRTERLLPVEFRRANLVAPAEIEEMASASVIFCRNVFIYFSADSIRRTVAGFARAMPAGGHLFIGASESLLKLTPAYELHEINDAYVYLRNSLPA